MILNVEKMADGSAFRVASIRQEMPLQPEAAVVSPGTQEADATAATAAKKGSSKSKLIDDATLKEVIKNGLPNEVNQFLSALSQYERKVEMGMANSARSEMYSLLSMANSIINNKQLFNQTLKQAEKQDCMSDYAISSNGGLYVKNSKGDIQVVSLSQYDKNKDQFQAMTYGDLANQRMYGANQSFDTGILETIHSAVGMNKVQEHIWNIVRTLGSENVSQKDYESILMVAGRDLKNPTKSQREGFEQLLQAYENMDPNSLFSVMQQSKSPDIQAAFKYIWDSLPNNYKMQLSAQSVIDNGIDSDPRTLIAGALAAGVDTESKYSVNFQEHVNKATGATSGKREVSMKPVEQFMDGNLNKKKITFSDGLGGNQDGITFYGNTMPAITDDRGNALNQGPLFQVLKQGSSMGKYLDFNYVYVGSQKVNGMYLQNMAYDGGQVANVWVPVTQSGDIDMTKLKKFQAAQETIQDILSEMPKDTDAQVIMNKKNEIYRQYGLNIQELPDGTFKDAGDKMAQYMVVYASVEDGAIAKNNWLVHEYTGQDEDLANDQIKMAFSDNKGKVHQPFGFFHRMFNDTYRAPVFIKINDFASYDAASYAGHGSMVTKGTLEQNMVRQGVQFPTEQAAPVQGSASLLFE